MNTDMLELVSFVFSPAIPRLMALLFLFVIGATAKQHLYSQ